MHIPKTAGTSLRAQLTQWCQPGEIVLAYGNELCAAAPNREFIETVERQGPAVKVVIGHFGWGARELLGQPTAPYATILREPLARAKSFYGHVSREPRSRHYRAIQQGMSLTQLVLSHRAPELNNHYVRTLLGSDRWRLALWPPNPTGEYQPIDQLFDRNLMEEAWNHLTANFCHVGRTERFGDTLAALAKILGATQVGVEKNLNARPADTPPIAWDAATEAIVRQYNALDLELYRRTMQRWG